MKVERLPNGEIMLELELEAGNQLAGCVIENAEEMRSAVLELAYLLRTARYNSRNNFQQPADPWGPNPKYPPSHALV